MQGKVFWKSKEKDEKGECRYQTLACSKAGQIYLLKLYADKVQVEQFSNFSKQKQFTVNIEKDDWNYLQAEVTGKDEKQQMVIVFGKSYVIDEKEELPFEVKSLEKKEAHQICSFNKDEHVIIFQL